MKSERESDGRSADLIVQGLAAPGWLIEIEAIAAAWASAVVLQRRRA